MNLFNLYKINVSSVFNTFQLLTHFILQFFKEFPKDTVKSLHTAATHRGGFSNYLIELMVPDNLDWATRNAMLSLYVDS